MEIDTHDIIDTAYRSLIDSGSIFRVDKTEGRQVSTDVQRQIVY